MKTIFKIFILLCIFANTSTYSEVNLQQKKFYYENLVSNWSKIFPDSNRNAAGPRFFKYMIDQDLTYEEFMEYNKLYCPVSGSLINPGEKPDFIFVQELRKDIKVIKKDLRAISIKTRTMARALDVEDQKGKPNKQPKT